MLQQSHLSTEYVSVQVGFTVDGSSVSPTADAVYLAFKPAGTDPATGDWNEAEWDTVGSSYFAQVLVGPENDGVVLPAGTYSIWVRVPDNPEVPVRPVTQITIT